MEKQVLLGSIEYNEAKRIQALLEERKIRLQLVGKPETCGKKGCRILMDVFVDERDLPQVAEFFKQERSRELEGLNANPELHAEVFDSEKEEAKCPACGTQFSTQNKECPECGLVFVIEEQQE